VTPTVTPTVTPPPGNRFPSSARLTYKIAPNGDLLAINTYDTAPLVETPNVLTANRPQGSANAAKVAAGTTCSASLYGRRTRADRSGKGPIKRLVQNKPVTERTVRFRAPGLRRAQCDFGGKPFTYHMIVRTSCGGKTFFSNVSSRRTNCGKNPPLGIERWEEQLTQVR